MPSDRKSHWQLPTVDLPSLDPPGTRRHLLPPFKPSRNRPTGADASRVMSEKPFDTLPRALIPVPNYPWQPPLMHYGWELGDCEKLLEYARRRHLTIEYNNRELRDPDDPEDEDEDEDEDEEDAGEDKGSNNEHGEDPEKRRLRQLLFPTCIRLPKEGVNKFRTLARALPALARDLGVHFPRGTMRIESTIRKREGTIVSLYTNYDLDKKLPSEDEIAKLGNWLEMPEKPKWYLDYMQWKWNPYGRRW